MEISKQLTSLSLSKRLKELGVKQDAHFGWIDNGCKALEIKSIPYISEVYKTGAITFISCSAFSVAELYEIFTTDLSKSQVGIHWNHNLFTVSFQGKIMFHNKQLVDAMAKMLIYLIENKLIDGVMLLNI